MRVAGYLAAIPTIIKEKQKEMLFRVYVTDALRHVAENTAKYSGGSYLPARWRDLVDQMDSPPDERTGDEIAADIIKRAGLSAKKGGEKE